MILILILIFRLNDLFENNFNLNLIFHLNDLFISNLNLYHFSTSMIHLNLIQIYIFFHLNEPFEYDFYCPQSFSGGGLYLNGSCLLWSVYDGLLWYMGDTSMSQFHTEWSHF